jgi:integrase
MPYQNNTFVFTKSLLENIQATADQRTTYHDAHKQAAGLQLRVTIKGSKSFSVFRRTKGGRPERVTLGTFPEMTIGQARRQAALISAAIAEGANPAAVRRAHKAEETFSELFDEYLRRHAKPNKKTWQEDEQRYNQYLKRVLGNRKISTVDRRLVAAIHSEVTIAGHPAVANRVLALISGIFGWAINVGILEKNPAKGIKRNREKSRDRFLQSDELPKLFQALAESPNINLKDFVLLALLTGARRANVLSMQWSDINFSRAEWRIEETKNGTPQVVTLSPEAMVILKARRDKINSNFVFPGIGITGHLTDPKKGWERLLDRAGLKNLRIHDLRRTLGSWQAKTGASLAIIGKSLNHKNVATTAIYARLDLDPVRDSVNAATTAMMSAGRKSVVRNNDLSDYGA